MAAAAVAPARTARVQRALPARASRASQAARARTIAQHERRYRKVADRYFAGFYRRVAPTCARVARDVKLTKADLSIVSEVYAKLGTFAWDQETRILTRATSPVLIGAMTDAWRYVDAEVPGAGVSFDLNARPVRSIVGGVGLRIRQVEDTSRQRIATMIADGIEKGLSVEQIVRGVPPGKTSVRGPIPEFPGIRGLVDSWTSTGTVGFRGGGTGTGSRSYLIARTEVANAYNLAACDAYASSGVDFLEVFDGQDCGWSSHDSPDTAHGSIRSVEECARQPISHPRCQRAFGARLDATVAAPSPYADSRARGGSVPGATPGIGAVDPLDAEALHLSGYEKVSRPSADVAQAAQRQWERARAAEPGISKALQVVTDGRMVTYDEAFAQAAAAPGGDLAGFAARRKSLTSLSRKMQSEIDEVAVKEARAISGAEAATRMGDTVRYTVRFQPGEYGAGARQIAQELVDAGNRPWAPINPKTGLPEVRWKVKWADDVDPAYRGINSNWVSPNGTVFEVQFHTPASFYVKENLNHKLYEEWRLPTTSVARQQELVAEMARNIASIEVPGGIPSATEISAMAARETASGAAAAAARSFDVFADPDVVAARARYDAFRAIAGPQQGEELVALYDEYTALVRSTIARHKATIRAMPVDEARTALARTRSELADLEAGMSRARDARQTAEATRLREARDFLRRREAELRAKLPFDERVIARPLEEGLEWQTRTRAYDTMRSATLILEDELLSTLGLRSKWTGKVEIGGTGPGALAEMGWEGDLGLARSMGRKSQADYLHAIVHESLHSFSDAEPGTYLFRRGWEEGVVEGMTRVLETKVGGRMGLAQRPGFRAYPEFVNPLEEMREALGLVGDEFYGRLLSTTAGERSEEVRKMIAEKLAGAGLFGNPLHLEGIMTRLEKALNV